MGVRAMTPEVRVSFPNVFKPRPNKLKGNQLEYSIVLLFPKGADISKLKAAAEAAMVEKFGPDKTKWPKNYNHPFKDQGIREKDGIMPPGYQKGCVMITAASKDKPGVLDPNKDPILEPSDFYAGCYARVTLDFWAYDHSSGQRGVSCTLGNIMKTRDGEPLGAVRPSAESEFSAVEGAGNEGASAGDMFDPMG